ncbi:MAG: response regulator transcription factor [Actinomycetota bacterium]|jgi:DNA-binding NarL/FixJ family response regulator|nr:response regulator transcription factor [Actinomycetota bacterium]
MKDLIRVLIADDHELVRYALRTLLEGEPYFEVVGEAWDSASAIAGVQEHKPDVLLLDMRMPGGGGIVVCQQVTAEPTDTRVLVLTSFDDDDDVFGVLSAGASGYILKDMRPDAVIQAVRAVADGQSVFDSGVASRVIAGQPKATADTDFEALSDRENDVLKLMARGLSNKEIGRALWIGETTVKTHVSHILRKLSASDRTQAVLNAVKVGIVELPAS